MFYIVLYHMWELSNCSEEEEAKPMVTDNVPPAADATAPAADGNGEAPKQASSARASILNT